MARPLSLPTTTINSLRSASNKPGCWATTGSSAASASTRCSPARACGRSKRRRWPAKRSPAPDIPWPEPQFLPELDEHHVDRLIKQGIDTVVRDFPHVGPLHEAYHAATEPRDKQRTFQLMFEEVVMLWVQDKVAVDGVESWPAFREPRAGRIAEDHQRRQRSQCGGIYQCRRGHRQPASRRQVAPIGPPSTWAGACGTAPSPISSFRRPPDHGQL